MGETHPKGTCTVQNKLKTRLFSKTKKKKITSVAHYYIKLQQIKVYSIVSVQKCANPATPTYHFKLLKFYFVWLSLVFLCFFEEKHMMGIKDLVTGGYKCFT